MIIKNKLERLMFNDAYNERHKNGPRFCGDCIYNLRGEFYNSYYIGTEQVLGNTKYLYLLAMKIDTQNGQYVEVREALLSEDCSTWNYSNNVEKFYNSKDLKDFVRQYKSLKNNNKKKFR